MSAARFAATPTRAASAEPISDVGRSRWRSHRGQFAPDYRSNRRLRCSCIKNESGSTRIHSLVATEWLTTDFYGAVTGVDGPPRPLYDSLEGKLEHVRRIDAHFVTQRSAK